MKSFGVTVWIVIILFVGVMVGVATVAMARPSNAYKLDTAQMKALREQGAPA